MSIYNQYEKKDIQRTKNICQKIIDELIESIVPDKTTDIDLELHARELVQHSGLRSAFYGYRPRFSEGQAYPFYLCVSFNNEIIHGLPTTRTLKTDDLLTIDLGIKSKNTCADLAQTIWIGHKKDKHLLIQATEEAFADACEVIKDGLPISELALSIEMCALRNLVHVAEGLTGHGCGKKLHEEPSIPNSTSTSCIGELKKGMILCIEPMFCENSGGVMISPNKWTILTQSGGLSAHYERMVYVTQDGCEIL